jgi:hypothetical protein
LAARGAERTVITLWRDVAAAHALDHSAAYKAAVADIEATGLLCGDSTLEVLEAEGVFLTGASTTSCAQPRDRLSPVEPLGGVGLERLDRLDRVGR